MGRGHRVCSRPLLWQRTRCRSREVVSSPIGVFESPSLAQAPLHWSLKSLIAQSLVKRSRVRLTGMPACAALTPRWFSGSPPGRWHGWWQRAVAGRTTSSVSLLRMSFARWTRARRLPEVSPRMAGDRWRTLSPGLVFCCSSELGSSAPRPPVPEKVWKASADARRVRRVSRWRQRHRSHAVRRLQVENRWKTPVKAKPQEEVANARHRGQNRHIHALSSRHP